MKNSNSMDTARAALYLAMSSRKEEVALKENFLQEGIRTAAVDFGGEFNKSVPGILERTVVAARREKLIKDCHVHQGAVSGAVHDALSQVTPRAIGLNVGGKIGIARDGEHLVVAVFFGIGMLNLDEVAVGLSHRSIPRD
ncbi:MAG: HutP family protein [Halanaerobium sp.]|nr:HutP family protein [Halanaerobium sp.]